MFLLLTFKGFEEKGEAWIVNSDISDDEFNNLKNVAKETGGDDGSLLFWIRFYGEIVDYALTFKIVDDTLETVDSLQELIQRSSEEGNVVGFPEDERLTEGNNGDVLTFPAEEFTVPTGTPAFELGKPIGFDDNAFFPKGDGFLDDILNGRFEFPAEDELTFALFDIAGKAGNDLGDIREQAVADLLGVEIVKSEYNDEKRKMAKMGTAFRNSADFSVERLEV